LIHRRDDFTGRTTIIAGALAGTSGILVGGSGTLRLAGSGDRVGDTVPLQFTGGRFETAGLSETAGAFTLGGSATLDFGYRQASLAR
jgi:hypothetical protein